jgi:hypothetical protein
MFLSSVGIILLNMMWAVFLSDCNSYSRKLVNRDSDTFDTSDTIDSIDTIDTIDNFSKKIDDLELNIDNHNLKISNDVNHLRDSISHININNLEESVNQVYSATMTLFTLNPANNKSVIHIELINKRIFTVGENKRWLRRKLDPDFYNLYLKQLMFYATVVYGGSIHLKHSKIHHTITNWDSSIECNIESNSESFTISDLMSIQEKNHTIVWERKLVPVTQF